MIGETLGVLFGYTQYVVNANCEGIDQEDSLVAAAQGGNCMNWVLGHIVSTRNGLLSVLGKEAAWTSEKADRYGRGTEPIQDGKEAAALDELLTVFNASQETILKGLAEIPAERFAEPAPFSPTGKEDETVGSLVAALAFHEAYHAGQLGTLRRLANKPGAVQ
jgi:uncharacterized damage-inducible protein DinB